MRSTLFLLLFAIVGTSLSAQNSAIKIGRKHMENLAYMDAIEHYSRYLSNEKNQDAEAIINLAEAYRKVNAHFETEEWYRKVVQLPEAQPIHHLYYGMALQRNGKCELAKDWYQKYVEARPHDLRGQHLLRACDFEEELMKKSADLYEITHCDFNSDLDDFSPTFYKKGLVFSSDRDRNPIIVRQNAWTGNPFLEFYYVDVRDQSRGDTSCGNYVFGRPEKFSNKVNSKYNDASATFYNKGKSMYFTRNNFLNGDKGTDDEGVMKLKIYNATDQGEGEYGNFVDLPFNGDEYNVAHPSLTEDGTRLYFCSDMPGGYGGMDLYYSEKQGSGWGPAMNLGPGVNTEGHELFPTSAPDGRLYFASDGLVGLGGLDIFYIESREDSWTTPENLGFPINTISDDFAIVFNEAGTCGFFASDRAGGVGRDDIYSFKKLATPVEVYVYDASNEMPIEGAEVQISCKDQTLYTDASGKIALDMRLNDCCDFTANFEDYEENKVEGCTNSVINGEKLIIEIPMQRLAEFQLEGVVFNDETGLPVDEALVTLENDCGEEIAELVLEPTNNGRFYFKLSEDCCYKVKAEKGGYLADWEENICTKGLEDSKTFQFNLHLQPVSISGLDPTDPEGNDPEGEPGPGGNTDNPGPNDIYETETEYTYPDKVTGVWIDKETGLPADGEYPDGSVYEKGAAITGVPDWNTSIDGESYLVHIYYDFDEAFIREDAVPELEKLHKMMVENGDLVVEIGSHTDSRGSTRYNVRLSQRRADAVVQWLVDRGIAEDRLVPRGYGEKKNVNNCANFIPCSERDHQLNRRTEFKVIGCLTCVDPAKKVISKPQDREKVEVNECLNCPF